MPGGVPNAAPSWSGWPLVGRESELAEISWALTSQNSRGVVIIAAPGVGKTRLAREALAEAAANGAFTIWVQATRSAATIPLGALASLIPADTRPDDPVALIRSCSQALHERAAGRRAVVAVDDAQLLDAASAALVLHLTTNGDVSVVVTVRYGEPCPDAIMVLWKDDLTRRLELAPLADEQVREMVEAALGAPIEEAVLQWLVEVSQGNAMYVRELVRGALTTGHLVDDGGFWRLEGQPQASSSLVDLVRARISGLSPEATELVQLLALSEPVTVSEALQLSSEEALLEIEGGGLITSSTREVRLSHPLYGEAVRGSLLPLTAAALCRRLVAVIEARPGFGPDEALRVARLRLDAGEPLSDVLLLQAADAANRAGDPEFGQQLAEMIPRETRGMAAAMLLARSLTLRNRYAEAEAALAAVEQIAGDDPDVHEYLRRRLWLSHWGMRDHDGLSALLARASGWRTDPEWKRFVEIVGQRYLALDHDFGDRASAAELADNENAPAHARREGRAAYVLSTLLAGEGNLAAAAAFKAQPLVSDDIGEVALLGALSLSAIETGYQWTELEAYMGDALRQAVRQHQHAAGCIAAFTLGRMHFLRGRFADATRWLAEARSHASMEDPFSVLTHIKVLHVGISAFSGDFDGTMRALESLHRHCERSAPLPVGKLHIARAEGWATRVRSPGEAGEQLLAAAAEFDHFTGLVPQLLYDAMRCGAAAATPQLATLASRNNSRLVGAYAQHASAKAADDGAGLMSAAEEMAAIGAFRYAVEAASDAAAAFISAGRSDSARRAAARARELHVPDQGWALPRIDGLDATAIALTPREEQLIGLASQGLSNVDIADRLVLSVRTVETHLYRGMQKLGISDRRDL